MEDDQASKSPPPPGDAEDPAEKKDAETSDEKKDKGYVYLTEEGT